VGGLMPVYCAEAMRHLPRVLRQTKVQRMARLIVCPSGVFIVNGRRATTIAVSP
jgi:hypothetical protein